MSHAPQPHRTPPVGLSACLTTDSWLSCRIVDDMRTSLGAYNFSLAHTPNIDKLASESLTFKRAYVQYGARPSPRLRPPGPTPALTRGRRLPRSVLRPPTQGG